MQYAVADNVTGAAVPASALSYNGKPGPLRTNTDTKATVVVARVNNTTAAGTSLAAGSDYTWTAR